jgi:Tfp pilus assembly protein PilZ
MRKYIRHPAGVPIEVKAHGQMTHDTHHTVNLGMGGLAFRCDREFAQGERVEIRIPFVQPPFDVEARVAWCKPHGGGFELGVEFLKHDDAFMARMVEQVCHIDNYRKAIFRAEGRQLSADEAAREWISKHAAKFPS